MKSDKLPIACTLNDDDFQRRRAELLEVFQERLLERKELQEGYAYRFASDSDRLNHLVQLVSFERECCPFLTFNLRLEPASGPIWLEMTGPEGTKEFLRSLVGQ